jgi:hypothetical protein
MKRTASATYLAAMLLAMQSATANDTVTITPGLWESTVTIESSFMPAMPPQTTQECVQKSTYDIRNMLRDQGECRITETSLSGAALRWKMSCRTAGGPQANGQGEVVSHGDRIEGNMTMDMSMQGQSITLKTIWTGKRIGDC